MALAPNDFADEMENLRLLKMMVIVYSSYYEKGVSRQSNDLDPKIFSGPPSFHLFCACCLTHPLFGSLHGP